MAAFDDNKLNDLYSQHEITNQSFINNISRFSNTDKQKVFDALSNLYSSGGEYKQNAITSVINNLSDSNSLNGWKNTLHKNGSKNGKKFLDLIDKEYEKNLQSGFENFIGQNKISSESFRDAYGHLSLSDREKALVTFNNELKGLNENNNVANATYNLLEKKNWDKDSFTDAFVSPSTIEDNFWTQRDEAVNTANKNGTKIDRINSSNRQGLDPGEGEAGKDNIEHKSKIGEYEQEEAKELNKRPFTEEEKKGLIEDYGIDPDYSKNKERNYEESIQNAKNNGQDRIGSPETLVSGSKQKKGRRTKKELKDLEEKFKANKLSSEELKELYNDYGLSVNGIRNNREDGIIGKSDPQVRIGGKNHNIYKDQIRQEASKFVDVRTKTFAELEEIAHNGPKIDTPKSSFGGKAALAVGGIVAMGSLVHALSDSRGQQSNAQLYGQQPLQY